MAITWIGLAGTINKNVLIKVLLTITILDSLLSGTDAIKRSNQFIYLDFLST